MTGLFDILGTEAKKTPEPKRANPLLSEAPRPVAYPTASFAARPAKFTTGAPKLPLADPFLAYHRSTLDRAGDAMLTFDEATWDHDDRSAVGVDVESFENFFLVCFKRFSDGKRLAFEHSDRSALPTDLVRAILDENLTVSFNGIAYDLPMIFLALGGASTAELKAATGRIINENWRPWESAGKLGVRVPPTLNHIDLLEPNPSVRQSLKMLHGRLHGRFIVDLPFGVDAWLSTREMNVATLYCHNDLDATEGLWNALREPMELRVALSREYHMDLRSKSDAQIGEAIVRKMVGTATRRAPGPGKFGYKVPDFLEFAAERLRDLARDLGSAEFSVDAAGKIVAPTFLANLMIAIGKMEYSFGIGGLHSAETHRAVVSDDEHVLIDVDVSSQYPNIIAKLGMYPPALGPKFLPVYRRIIDDRLNAKAMLASTTGDERERWKARSDGGKIVANGIFGKLGSTYSMLYAPHLLIGTTLTGQLSLLMLIERAEAAGIPVVSGNTDSVVFHCPRMKENNKLDPIVADWEERTGFRVERTRYRGLYSSSVNTYVAVGEDGKVKRKGPPADPWTDADLRGQMSKNPQMTVLSEAVVRHLLDGTPIEATIRDCADPRMFVTLIRVANGGIWRGMKLGRAVRFYWSLDGDPIMYADSSRKVAKTDNAKPLMEMLDRLPDDLDRARYVAEAYRLARDLAVLPAESGL